jgi:transcriptional regulator with XRE-family HTH domain
MKTTGEKIRKLRERNGDTLEELGNKIGMSWGGLSKIERGTVEAKDKHLRKIAEVYDIEAFEYFFDELAPEELKGLGVQWISFAKELKEKELTRDEILAAVEIIEKFRKKD